MAAQALNATSVELRSMPFVKARGGTAMVAAGGGEARYLLHSFSSRPSFYPDSDISAFPWWLQTSKWQATRLP